MDTAFAKVVTDLHGVDHILIEGTLISLDGPRDKNNELVDVIVRGLRGAARGGLSSGSASVIGRVQVPDQQSEAG